MKVVKIFIILMIIFLLTSLSAYYIYAASYSKKSGDEAVFDFLKSIKAENITCNLTDWSLISKEYKSLQQLKSLFKDVETVLFTRILDFKEEQSEENSLVLAEGYKEKDTYVKLALQSFKIPPGFDMEGQTFIAINVMSNNCKKLEEMKKIIKEVIEKNGGKSRITTCFYGQIYSKLDINGQNNLIEELNKKLHMEYFDISKDGERVVVRGYSKLFEEGLLIMDKLYNVEVEISEDEEKNNTIIWIGVPVLTAEF